MAKTYQYTARDRSGQLVTGSVLADGPSAVAAHVRGQGFYVTKIKEKTSDLTVGQLLDNLHKVSVKELALLCRQFATMLEAGLPIVSCMNVLIEQAASRKLKAALQDVYKKITEGQLLSQGLKEHPTVFPDVMVNMIEAGEVGGVLDKVLDRLATHFEKEAKLNEKVKSALTYPAVVVVMAILCVTFLVTFVLPTFNQLFANFKMELPLPTRILLAVSNLVRDHLLLLILLLAAAGSGLVVASKQERFRRRADLAVLKLPIFGPLIRKIAIARFSRMLSTLLRGGVPIITALEVVKKTLGNYAMTSALTRAQYAVQEGQGLAATIAGSNVFTPMVIQMVAIGEESGALDMMLAKIADFYESDVDDAVSRLSSVIEPIIIGGLGLVVGFIVISIVIPMFDVVTNVGKAI